MRLYFFLLFMSLSILNYSYAQKPAIDTSVYKAWPSIELPHLSDDGKYVMYTVTNDSTEKKNLS